MKSSIRSWAGHFVLMLAAGVAVNAEAMASEPVDVNFETSVQPILAEHCLVCHGQDVSESNLRLDRRDAALAMLDSGKHAIVPGHPEQSELLRRVVENGDLRMPPDGQGLTKEQVATLRRWILDGASWQSHWAYRPLDDSRPSPVQPAAQRSGHPIDQYIHAGLGERGLTPSPRASRSQLARRLSIDLLGLPPSPRERQDFIRDKSPDSFVKLVDRLLSSPRFGERWGRHWLDKARYADSDGYEKDRPRPDAFRYRDWVIEAINSDLAFDQFTIDQLAGDLISEAAEEQIVATAFHRQTLTNTEGGTDKEQWRVAAVMDRTETMGTVWLGLTVGCARCHTHKYDAITHQEYYQLFAFFNNADETNIETTHSPQASRERTRLMPAFLEKQQQLRLQVARLVQQLGQNQQSWEAWLARSGDPATDGLIALASKDASQRERREQARLDKAYAKAQKRLADERQQLDEHQRQMPTDTLSLRVVKQRENDPRETFILRRGNFDQPLDEVQPRTLASLPTAIQGRGKGDAHDVKNDLPVRLQLAQWLVDGQNPLVPRVVANHVWQNLFGVGLVRTPNDFGVRGERPTYPRLLDHLAREYVRLGWSRKRLIRYIVLSETYQQSSSRRGDLQASDPDNHWLARQNRFRVEAEIVRDMCLAVSGMLSNRVGGPSVFPPMPPEVAAISYANNFKWLASAGEDRYRRGMYTFFKRTSPHPTLMTFDCPDANTTNVKRNRSNTPLAALTLMNNEVYLEAASALADDLLASDGNDRQRLAAAMDRCLARDANPNELDLLGELLDAARLHFSRSPREAANLAIGPHGGDQHPVERAAWAVTMRAVLNLDEFITRE